MVLKSPDWTLERISALDPSKIQSLLENAKLKKDLNLMSMCEQAISELPKEKKPRIISNRNAPNTTKSYAKEVSTEIGNYIKQLSKEFDMSENTARYLSKDTKGYKYHSITDAKGLAKSGGPEKSGLYEFDRYTSFRIGNDIIALSAFLPKEAPINETRFQIQGPKQLVEDGVEFKNSGRSGSYGLPSQLNNMRFKDFSSLDEALKSYRALLVRLFKHWNV